MGPIVKHVLAVLELSYVVPEKTFCFFFQNRVWFWVIFFGSLPYIKKKILSKDLLLFKGYPVHLVQNYTKKDIPNSKRIICYKSCQLNLQLIKYSWWWCYSSMADFSLGFNTTLWIFLYWYSEEFFESIYMGSVWVKSQMAKGRWGLFLYHSCSKCEYVEFFVTKIHIL